MNVESSFCDRSPLLYLVCLHRCTMLEKKRVNSRPGGILVKDVDKKSYYSPLDGMPVNHNVTR